MIEKTGRNAPCPCGSGRKYKRCCSQQKEEPTSSSESKKLDLAFLKSASYETLVSFFAIFSPKNHLEQVAKKIRDIEKFFVERLSRCIRWHLALEKGYSLYVSAQCVRHGFLEFRCSCCEGAEESCEHIDVLVLLIWMGFHTQQLPEALRWEAGAYVAYVQSIAESVVIFEKELEEIVEVESLLLCSKRWKTCDLQQQASFEAVLTSVIAPSAASPRESQDAPEFNLDPDELRNDLFGADLSYQQEKSYLAQLLQYRFSNGVIVSVADLLKQKEWIDLPRELDPNAYFMEPSVQKSGTYHIDCDLSFLEESEDILFSILMEAWKTGIPIFLVQGQDASQSRNALRLRQLQFAEKSSDAILCAYLPSQIFSEDQQAECQDGTVLLQWEAKRNRFVFPGFSLFPATGTLTFHSWLRMSYALKRFFQVGSFFENKEEHFWFLKKHHEIRTFIEEECNPVFKRIGVPLIQMRFPKPKVVGAEALQTKIHFQSGTLDFRFLFEWEATVLGKHQKIQSWNLPSSVKPLMVALQEGISIDFVYGSDGVSHLFKNRGHCMLIVLELASYALDQTKADGTPLTSDEDFWDQLDLALGALFFSKKDVPESRSPARFSLVNERFLVVGLKEWCFRTLEAFRLQTGIDVVLYDQVIHLQGAHRIAWRFLQQVLFQLGIQTAGHCFQKIRVHAFENFMNCSPKETLQITLLEEHAISYKMEEKGLSSLRNWISLLLPLCEKGYQVWLDDKCLEPLASSDLQAKIEFQSPQNSASDSTVALDWFELHPRLFFRGIEVDPLHLARWQASGLFDHQGKLYYISEKNLPSIKRLENFWKRLQIRSGVPSSKNKKIYYPLPRSEILELLALRASGAIFEDHASFREICEFYDGLDQPRPELALPKTLPIALKPYQHLAVQWLYDLYRLRLGAILADDMGLGKTPQTIAFLELLRSKKQMGPTLIVVPSSLVLNWTSEIQRFAPKLPVYCFDSKFPDTIEKKVQKQDHCVVIATYGLLTEHIHFFETLVWNICVFDEAQNLKNILAKRTEAARKLQARFKLCLTGTPLENHMGELYALLDLVVPGCLGNYLSFRDRYVQPDVILGEDIEFLKLKMRPLVLRRTKAQILSELPEKIQSTIKLPFEKRQEKIYRDIALAGNQKIKEILQQKGASRTQLEMLAALLRLRQACSDPGGLPGVRYLLKPPKIAALQEALTEITTNGQSALVFTQFLATFHRMEKAFQKEGILVFSMNGSTSIRERASVLKKFQEETRGCVLLMTLKTGGVGLNLVKASYVFHLEPWWNPAAENQATDRAHRMGQSRCVQVFRYLMQDSVEEKIQTLQGRKQATFDALFSETENLSTKIKKSPGGILTQSDFEYLIRSEGCSDFVDNAQQLGQ